MLNKMTRGRFAPLVGGLLATSVLTFTAGAASGAQAGSAGNVTTAAVSTADSARATINGHYGTLKSRVIGSFGKNGTVTGEFKPRRFTQEGGQLMAVGRLTATLTRGSGKVVGTDSKVVTIPVKSAEGTSLARVASRAPGDCEILHLVLGPLDLNLLGLKVHLDKVVLNIDAEPGAGNLLGNLLCAVAGLLDGTGVLTQIRQILNSILEILRLPAP
jgi:hypothetical protein